MPEAPNTSPAHSSGSDIPDQSADIVIIGAGPAGSTAAALLAMSGYEVTVLERAKHPREHVGESVIPHFWKYCDRLQIADQLLNEGFLQKAGGTVVWKGEIRQMAFKEFGYSRPALHVERDRFDYLLLQNSRSRGASVFENIMVSRVEHGPDGTMLVYYRHGDERTERQIRCRQVIDASGQSSLIARQFKLRQLEEGFRFLALWGYFQDSKFVDARGQVQPFANRYEIPPTTFVTSIGDNYGWSWHITLRENTSVGLVLPIRDLKSQLQKGQHESFYLQTCRSQQYLGRLLEPATHIAGSFRMTRDYSYKAKEFAGPGWILVGDAAAFVDPIFSLGVTFAMYTGALAAQLIDNGLRRPESMPYCRWVYGDQLSRRIATARALALPNFMSEDSLTDDLKPERLSFEWEPEVEKSLMHTVALMTNRSVNFHHLAQGHTPDDGAQFSLLEDIQF